MAPELRVELSRIPEAGREDVHTRSERQVEVPRQMDLRVEIDVAVSRFEITEVGVGAISREVAGARNETEST